MPTLPTLDPAWILWVFACCFTVRYAVEAGLTVLNLGHAARHGGRVPPALQGRVSPETAERSQAYTQVRGRFGLLRQAAGTALTAAVLFSGVLPWLDARLSEAGLTGAHRFVAFLVALAAASAVVALPFGLYGTFVIESRFGFNRQSLRGWLADRVRGLVVSVVLGLPFLYAVYGFMAYTGAAWWLWLLGFIAVWQLVMVWLYPTLIAPLFNRFEPLPSGALRTQAEALTRRAGFRTRGLYVMDASRRSGHSNAYFIGFWRPRIVLFDTLLRQLALEPALAVLAHEIGHYRARHVHKALALNLVGMAVGLFVLSLLVAWPPLFAAFGFDGPSLHVAVALLVLGGGAFTFPLQPLTAWFSRRNEYEADAYASRLTGQPQALAEALVVLGGENLSNLAPHPWYSRFYYSHPTLPERLAALTGEGSEGLRPRPAGG